MSASPKISVLLCTVRGDGAYTEHPEWDVLGKVAADLEAQTFRDFELVVVDGLCLHRDAHPQTPFRAQFLPPHQSFWVQHRKVAISAYRNTGIAAAKGELIVNLDDCCELPPNYLELFWRAWHTYGVCLAATWPGQGDSRPRGLVQPHLVTTSCGKQELRPAPGVYGFGSYPREAALRLNGYDEAYDGSQGLEDCDWSTRLTGAGVPMALEAFDGFKIHAQSRHDPRAVDTEHPLAKCCNQAWWLEREALCVRVANQGSSYGLQGRLVGPCHMLRGEMCGYHGGAHRCAYYAEGFATALTELAKEYLAAGAPNFNLSEGFHDA